MSAERLRLWQAARTGASAAGAATRRSRRTAAAARDAKQRLPRGPGRRNAEIFRYNRPEGHYRASVQCPENGQYFPCLYSEIASIFAAALQCEDLQEEETEEPEQPVSQASGGLGRPMPGTAGAGGKAAPGAPGAGRQPAPRMRKRKLLEPCGRCLSCIQAQSGNQPDIITVSHEKPNSIGVGEIRRMRADLQIKPYSNARKVYIVPDAEKLTIPAQNALLKTLEEPPEYAVIILIVCCHYFDREWAVRFFADDTEQVCCAADEGGGRGADRTLFAAREGAPGGSGDDPGAICGRKSRAGASSDG